MNRNGCFPLLFVRLEQLYTETLEVISELLEKDLGEEAKREEKEKKNWSSAPSLRNSEKSYFHMFLQKWSWLH